MLKMVLVPSNQSLDHPEIVAEKVEMEVTAYEVLDLVAVFAQVQYFEALACQVL